MAIFIKGKRIQTSGYKPLTVNTIPVNASPANLSVLMGFCLYRIDGTDLELIGGCVVDSGPTYPLNIHQDIATLPESLTADYTMNMDKSEISAVSEVNNTVHIDRVAKLALTDNVLSLVLGSSRYNIVGGSVNFHLYFTKQ